MSLHFNTVLRDAGLDPVEVRLLRHKDARADRHRDPYSLWRDTRSDFEAYQSIQSFQHAGKLEAPYWASFVGTPVGETLFVGLYHVLSCRVLDHDRPMPHRDAADRAGSCNLYQLECMTELQDLAGRLLVDWGDGTRAWIQYAERQNKLIVELRRRFTEPPFPGFLSFRESLSRLDALPEAWISALSSVGGVYLLSCPRTREQYVGSASGEQGFWGRWMEYARNGHGGNTALKSRELSDYQACVLQVAGSASSPSELIAMETRWKLKLQSREMGLNRN